jgi:hypothetical protein
MDARKERKAKRRSELEQQRAEGPSANHGVPTKLRLECFCGFRAEGDGSLWAARHHANEKSHGVNVYPRLANGYEVIVPEV